MRNAVFIICILLLAIGFAASWLLLQPEVGESSVATESSAGLVVDADPSPLDLEDTRETAGRTGKDEHAAVNDSESRDDSTGRTRESDPGIKIGRESESSGQPGRTTPGSESAIDDTGEGTTPAKSDEADAPNFIRGHKRPQGQNLGNVRPSARRIASPKGTKELSEVTEKLRQDRRGLYAQYYQLDSGETLPDLDDPATVRIDRQVYFPDRDSFDDVPVNRDNFAAVWTGFLVIDKPGDYWLFWGADNGGRVELDGETVLLQDGMIRYVEVSAVLTLEAGLHPLRIEFAQAKNSVADWAKCAASFKWVPEGESKPVPVPPEMLMVPEWMWSDNAPIITGLSKYEGEIGDEITIKGQGFRVALDKYNPDYIRLLQVTFSGQDASVLEATESEVRVSVPIGAKTGNVIVFAVGYESNSKDGVKAFFYPSEGDLPSNSVSFTVTTQFGLMAEWYHLPGWDHYEFEDVLGETPAVTRLETDLNLESRDHFGLPFAQDSIASKWTGKFGVPAMPPSKFSWSENGYLRNTMYLTEEEFWGDRQDAWVLRVSCESWFQVAVPGHEARITDTAGFNGVGEPWGSLPPVAYDFVFWDSPERWIALTVEWLSASSEPASIRFRWIRLSKLDTAPSDILLDYMFEPVPLQHLKPEFVPPTPPKISDIAAIVDDNETYPVLPYDADPVRASVAIGQEFQFVLSWRLDSESRGMQVSVTVDSIPVEHTYEGTEHSHGGAEYKVCRAVMPEGVGEGRMVARLGMVSSEPVFIDIANRGLVTYLYDVPDASGLDELPDLQPLSCFKIRKDRAINYESAADFDLPFPAETFVIEWLGGLIIEEEGDYTFTCRSDDGMKLWLDDNVIIDANHRQAPAENSATVHLVPGVYRFRMQYFENNQHEVCVLEWQATRGEDAMQEVVIPREVIPAKAFSLDTHPPFPAKTSSGKRTDGS